MKRAERTALIKLSAVAAAWLAGCTPDPVERAACIEGPWLQSGAQACASHPWCESQARPPQCASTDCVVENVTVFRSDGVLLDVGIIHSPTERKFSRGAPPVEATWEVTADGKFRRGEIVAAFECTDDALFLGDGPFRARQSRAEGDFARALDSAAATGAWQDVAY